MQTLETLALPSTGNTSLSFAEARKPLVVYFYPKDNTPGCTNEAIAFRDLYPQFQALGVDIVGISRDSLKSHENFKAKFDLPFELLSDKEEIACQCFDVIKMKTLYGKQVRGIERSTFVIGQNCDIIQSWRGVKVTGHAEEVLASLHAMTQ